MREGLPNPDYWMFMVLFLIAAAATVYWIRLYIRGVWIGEDLLFAHYKRTDHFQHRSSRGVSARGFRPYNASGAII